MYVRNKLVSVGGWWPLEVIERIDKAREKTYLSRSVFIKRIVTEHLDEAEEMKKEQDNEK